MQPTKLGLLNSQKRSLNSHPESSRSSWQRFPLFSFVLAWMLLAAVWEIGAVTGVLNRDILPPPSVVIPYILAGPGSAGIGPQQVSYGEAILKTLFRVLTGLSLGMLMAFPLGIVLAATSARQIAMPMIQTIAPVAPVAWVPLAIALFGIGDSSAIFVVFMGVFAVMTLAVAAAVDGVPSELLKTARSLGAKRVYLWLWVVLPAIAPGLLTIVRVNFFAAWMAVLAGEMAGINSGLGALIIMGQQQFNMRLVMTGVITIGILGFVIDRVLLLVQSLLWWSSRSREAS